MRDDAAADGFYVTLPPLDIGPHTIHFKAGRGGRPLLGPDPFELDVTYNMTLSGRQSPLATGPALITLPRVDPAGACLWARS